ncbi:Transcriptional regulatory protein TcrA [Lactobacillus helveticus]|nr:Transcriptional regulatory protein TcrA [Lactobacillus helveticus]NRO70710.1 Transcriptional regulatory protein TcrA [Lactobacillus helveticus]
MRILVAEDEPQLLRVLTVAMQKAGYEVDPVDNGLKAVEHTKENSYDVIILDIMMPVMDRITALKEIRKSGDKSYILMLTAKSEIDDRVTGLDSGADDYLTKPFSLKELLARLRSKERRQDDFTPNEVSIGDVTLNVSEQELVSHNSIRLNGQETQLMDYFILNEDHLSPRNAQPAFGNQNDPINRNFLAGKYNPEAVYQYRYFSVTVDSSRRIHVINDNNVYKVKNTEIESITRRALDNHDKQGSIKAGQNQYAYRIATNSTGETLIIFLNETLIYQRFWLIFRVPLVLGIGALIVFALVLILVSGKAIKPITDTYHKQQEFITNAGHELKTPLAVIFANTEMEEILGNNSEWNQSTKEQVDKLTKLVNRLISLARAGETG